MAAGEFTMNGRDNELYDVVGIGFGPSNLSLAIAMEEYRADGARDGMRALFLERQPSFGWHRSMLLPSATMQISFLKDLVTFRNPTSSFSFIAYLHASGRLPRFVNNQDFFPTREEFHRYLEWAQARVADRIAYGAEVTSVGLPPGAVPETSDRLRLEVADGRVVEARNVVISTGLVPSMPDGAVRDERVWHSSEFLEKYRRADPAQLRRVAVVGAGQSAAEIARFLYDELPHAQVWAVIPSYGYSVADDTPFANQVFDPGAVDDYYYATEQTREAFRLRRLRDRLRRDGAGAPPRRPRPPLPARRVRPLPGRARLPHRDRPRDALRHLPPGRHRAQPRPELVAAVEHRRTERGDRRLDRRPAGGRGVPG